MVDAPFHAWLELSVLLRALLKVTAYTVAHRLQKCELLPRVSRRQWLLASLSDRLESLFVFAELETAHSLSEVGVGLLWLEPDCNLEPLVGIAVLLLKEVTACCVVDAAEVPWVDFDA